LQTNLGCQMTENTWHLSLGLTMMLWDQCYDYHIYKLNLLNFVHQQEATVCKNIVPVFLQFMHHCNVYDWYGVGHDFMSMSMWFYEK
jgi:hypothetical protein